MLFIPLCKAMLIYNNASSKYCRLYKKIPIKERQDFIHDNFYRRIQFPKESSYYSMKNQKKKNL